MNPKALSHYLWSIPNGSLYLKVLRVRFSGDDYVKAHVMWFYKSTRTFMMEEKNLKIPKSCFTWWEKERD